MYESARVIANTIFCDLNEIETWALDFPHIIQKRERKWSELLQVLFEVHLK